MPAVVKDLVRCPLCDSRRIRRVRETVSFGSRTKKLVVPDLSFQRCLACGEGFFDPEACDVIERYRRRRKRSRAREQA